MSRRSRSQGVLAAALGGAVVLAFATSACAPAPMEEESGSAPVAQTAAEEEGEEYCVDDNNNVIDPDYCEPGHPTGGWLIMLMGSHHYGHGQHVDTSHQRHRVRHNDAVGRQNAGFPASGRITNGQRIVVNSGLGKGSPGGNVGGAPKPPVPPAGGGVANPPKPPAPPAGGTGGGGAVNPPKPPAPPAPPANGGGGGGGGGKSGGGGGSSSGG